MTTLKAEKRDMDVKAKKLRRDGFVPGIVCGKEMKEALPVCIPTAQADRFLKNNRKGSRIVLEVGDKKINAIVKDTEYNALLKQIMFIDFQALVKGEKIHSTAQIVLKNEQMANGCINQELSEINYKAEPDDLVEEVVIDFNDLKDVRSIKVEDLDICKNKKVDVVTPGDTIILSVCASDQIADDTEEEAEATVAAE